MAGTLSDFGEKAVRVMRDFKGLGVTGGILNAELFAKKRWHNSKNWRKNRLIEIATVSGIIGIAFWSRMSGEEPYLSSLIVQDEIDRFRVVAKRAMDQLPELNKN
ncbi:MAG TPA: hypothetical protein VI320_32810 [Terracidiphilus sp.]